MHIIWLYLSLRGVVSVIIIANNQLRNTTLYLPSFSLEIVRVAVRWISKIGYHNFKNSFLILALLFLLFTVPVFHAIYLRESKKLKQEFQEKMKMYFNRNTCFRRKIVYYNKMHLHQLTKKRLALCSIKPRTYVFKKVRVTALNYTYVFLI